MATSKEYKDFILEQLDLLEKFNFNSIKLCIIVFEVK